MNLGIVSIFPEKNKKHSHKGGVASYTRNLVEGIIANDKKIKLTVLADRKGKEKSYFEYQKQVKIIRSWHRGYGFFNDIIRSIKKENLKVLHLHQEFRLYGEIFTSILFLWLLWRLKNMGIKTIVTVHGVLSKKAIDKDFVKENNINLPPLLVKLAFAFVFKGIGRLADRIIVHENLFKKFLINDYGIDDNKISVIFHGVEDKKAEITLKKARDLLEIKKKKIVLFFGYVTGYKSPDLLLEAFTDYSKIDKDSLLIFAGGKHPKMTDDNKYLGKYKKLKDLAKKIPKDQIWWYGFVEEKDIEKVVMASDLLVFPYNVAISASGPLAFALAYQKPFLISKPLFEMFNNKEIIFSLDTYDLFKKLKEFFSNKIKIDEFVNREREKRLWKVVAKETLLLYTQFHE